MAQICNEPNRLNYDRTTCVPGSDVWIPFPMLCFCALLVLIVAFGNCKSRDSRFVANLIVLLSIVEFAGIFIVLYFSHMFGIAPVVYMLSGAAMF